MTLAELVQHADTCIEHECAPGGATDGPLESLAQASVHGVPCAIPAHASTLELVMLKAKARRE